MSNQRQIDEHSGTVAQTLARVRGKWRTVLALTTLTRAMAAATVLLLTVLVAYVVVSPEAVWTVGLVGIALAGMLGSFIWFLWSVSRIPDDRKLARFVEERCPELEDRFATAVAVGAGDGKDPASLFLEPMLADAARLARTIDLDRVVSRTAVRRAAAGALLATSALSLVLFVGRGPAARALEVAASYVRRGGLVIHVEPGDIRLRAGRPILIHARLSGVAGGITRPPHVALSDDRSRTVTMRRAGGPNEFAAFLDSVSQSFKYRVIFGTLASAEYQVTVVRPPRVARIDLHYQYPPGTGLKARSEEDSGDVYGPAGTRVQVRIKPDRLVSRGELKMADGSRVPLALGPDVLVGELRIVEDGSYRVALADAEGLENPGDTEYFIRTFDDRPPDVRIIRPAGDRQVTALEEVAIEARADDDYGLERFDLVYAVRGGPEKVVPFQTKGTGSTLNGSHTLYLEELGVGPGDFITYYARARDVSKGRRPAESRSDIFFIEVKPYDEEFVAAQSQAMMGGGGRGLDDLAARQKEIIIATWKLDRRAASGRSQADIQSVARAQGELRSRAASVVAELSRPQTDVRWRRPRPGQSGSSGPESGDGPMLRAVESMGRAETSLERLKTAEALPHEMDALNQLLKAQADIRRRQVARQQANGGGGGANRATQDLSSLFDRELQRQQETNYETPTSSETRENDAQGEALDKVKDLASRQDELNRRQQDLAERREGLSAEELKRQLERLTREQSELRRQAEELSRQLSGRGTGSGEARKSAEHSQNPTGAGSEGQRLQDISEEMRSAASELRRQDPAQASARGGRALEKLRDLERRLQNSQPDDRRRTTGDLQLEARQLAEGQRQVADEVGRLSTGAGNDDAVRRIAGEKQRLADRASTLEQAVRQLADTTPGDSREERAAVDGVVKELDREQIARRMQEGADTLRRSAAGASQIRSDGTQPGRSSGETPSQTPNLNRQHTTEQELARALDRVADKLGTAGGQRDAESQKLADQLARTRELRDRLAEIERTLGNTRAAQTQAEAGSKGRQRGAADSSGTDGKSGQDGATGGGGAGSLARLQDEYSRQLREAQELMEQLRRSNVEGLGGGTPETWERSLSAPGTEAFKQDFSAWESLRRDVTQTLERAEQSLAASLRDRDTRDRLHAGPDDQVPESYRQLVEKYFQSLATRQKH